MAEQLANNAATTLNGAITNSATSLVVTSASGFPSSGTYRILIESEILEVTAVAGATWTVTRGQEGTAAVSHASGVAVTHVLTVEGMKYYRGDLITTGTWASRPAASTPGKIFLATDSMLLSRDSGSAWATFGPVWAITPPDNSQWSWFNQGSATITDVGGALVLYSPSNGGSHNIRGRSKTLPSAPYTCEFGICINQKPGGNAWAGVGWRQNSGADMHIIVFAKQGDVISEFWGDESTFSSTYFNQSAYNWCGAQIIWIRLVDDNTNRIWYISKDRCHWMLGHSVGRTSFMTADRVQFHVNPNSEPLAITLFHYREF